MKTDGSGWKKAPVILAALILLVALAALEAYGHTGRRLRLGFRPEPILRVLANMTKIYLEEVSGYTADLKEFEDPFTLQEAIREGRADLAVEYPAEAWARTACPTRGAFMENIFPLMRNYYRDEYGAEWVGMFNLRREGFVCYAPSYVITKEIAGSLTYFTLPDYLKKLLKTVKSEDVERLLAEDPTGRNREMVHAFLAGKKLI